MADKKDDISEDELDQIIQDMSKDGSGESVAKPAPEVMQSNADPAEEAVASNVTHLRAPSAPETTADQSLTLEMNGVINLKLNFKNGDRNIEVICGEEALICRMADGTEFRIPTGYSKARKAA